MNINHTFKKQLMKHQKSILAGNPKNTIFDESPDDAYVIDTRKDIAKLTNLFAPSSLDYAIAYAHSKGYSDDKIYLIYECYKVNGKVYIRKGSQCDKDEDEIIQGYNDMGLFLENEWDKNANGGDA